MRFKSLFQLKETVSLMFQTESGEPYAVRLDLPSLQKLVFTFGGLFFLFFLGTLLFFREMESTRQLEQRVLQLELQNRVNETIAKLKGEQALPMEGAAEVSTVVVEEPKAKRLPEKVEVKVATVAPATDSSHEKPVEREVAVKTPNMVAARVAQLVVNCQDGICDVNVSLIPSGPGVAKGSLIVVLEAEVARIGAAAPEEAVNHRYFIYPGFQKRDKLTQADLVTMPGSEYKFYQGLKRKVSFTTGKMIRPVAVTAYLFGEEGNILDSKRQAIQGTP